MEIYEIDLNFNLTAKILENQEKKKK